MIGQIGLLIQAGTNNDDWAFEEKHINRAADILFKSIDNAPKMARHGVLFAALILNTHVVVDGFMIA